MPECRRKPVRTDEFASSIKKHCFLVKIGNELQLTAKRKLKSEKHSSEK